MDFRRVGEALMRSQLSTIFTSASTVRSYSHRSPAAFVHAPKAPAPSHSITKRTIVSSAVLRQEKPAREDPSTSGQRRTPEPEPLANVGIDQMQEAIWSPRKSRYKSPSAQRENRNTTRHGFDQKPESSSAEDALNARRAGADNRINMSAMMMPKGSEFRDDRSYLKTPPSPEELPRLGPEVGRSVRLNTQMGQDLASGLRRLDQIVGRNKVRVDVVRQRFHERPGLKRKRLASQRWARRFKTGFKQIVSRVQHFRRQGW